MSFNCDQCQSEFLVLSGRIITKLSKTCFPWAYVDQMIIQQRLMFGAKFSFIIFLLMFFPLFSQVFSNILKIYELTKINNTVPTSCQKTCLNNNHLPGQFYVTNSSSFWTLPLLTLLKMCPWQQRTPLALNQKRKTR